MQYMSLNAVRRLSIERLARLAFDYHLVTHYNMSPRVFQIYQSNGVVVECDPEEARFFLHGLIGGYLHAVVRDKSATAAIARTDS